MKTDEGKKKAAQLMAKVYNIPPDDAPHAQRRP